MSDPYTPRAGQQCALPDAKHHKGLPGPGMALLLDRRFNPVEHETLKLGLIPQEMEDKWFVYFDSRHNDLFFHRSWTNICIFAVHLESQPDGGCRVVAVWANANSEQFRPASPNDAARLLADLLDLLLRSS